MPPTDEPGRRYREPRHGGVDPRWGGPGEADPGDDAYGEVNGDRWAAGRHGDGPPGPSSYDEGRFGPASGRHGTPDPDPLGGNRPTAEWPPPTALPSGPPRDPRRGPGPGQPPPPRFGQAPPSPPYGQAPPSPPYGQAPPSPPHGYGPRPPMGRPGGPPSNGQGPLPGAPARPAPTAVQPPADAPATPSAPATPATPPPADVPLLAGGIPPPSRSDPDDGSDVTQTTGLGPDTGKHKHRRGAAGDTQVDGSAVGADRPTGRRRAGAASGPGRDGDDAGSSGPGRRGRDKADATGTTPGGKKKRKGSFWRELPLLVVVAIVLTFVIQTFVARIYVIPSASMEQTLHGCTGCANDRVAVDKVSYRFSDPSPGDVVVFKGPPAWLDNDEVGDSEPSGNPIVRGFQEALSLVGLAAPNEKDFVKRVIAVGGQTVQCCDAQNRVLVDGRPLTEPYLYYQSGLGDRQAAFDPVQVPQGQLWVMGDNRNNSADARFHGPVPLEDVIGKVRVVVLPITRWRTVPAIDPQTTTVALAPPSGAGGLPEGTPELAGALLAVPVVWGGRRLRRAVAGTTSSAPPDPTRRREGPARE